METKIKITVIFLLGTTFILNAQNKIESAGNVGIGTTNPSEELEIHVDNAFGEVLISSERSGVNENLGRLGFEGMTTSSTSLKYAGIKGGILNNISGAYKGNLFLETFDSGNGGFTPRLTIAGSNVGIGTTAPDSKLTVAGNIHSREVKVTIDAGADFVFDEDYNLPSLQSLEKFIKKYKHLPEIASEKEMQKNGLLLAEMNIKLLQKIEELTLYTIQQQKEIEILIKEIEESKSINTRLLEMQKRLEKLEEK